MKVILGAIGVGLMVGLFFLRYTSVTSSQSIGASAFTADLSTPIKSQSLSQTWIVSADQAVALLNQEARLLDVRGMKRFKSRFPGAKPVRWQDFSRPQAPWRGNLLESDAVLTQKLQQLEIASDRPVVVVGDARAGWGEEGRIVWMLRTLGHDQAVWIDGGGRALKQALAQNPLQQSSSGNSLVKAQVKFQVNRRSDWLIQAEELRKGLDAEQTTTESFAVIDTREPREYAGRTPYGEQRGGHVPGAINIYFKDWLDEKGLLLPREVLLNQLAAQGITPETEVIAYCTGGIRSGWLVSVLVSLGFQAKNYAGSMWEWSALPVSEYPLVQGDQSRKINNWVIVER